MHKRYMVLPLHESFWPHNDMVKQLEQLVGPFAYLAYVALCHIDNFDDFIVECEAFVATTVEDIRNTDGLEQFNVERLLTLWRSPTVRLFMEVFWEQQTELMRHHLMDRANNNYWHYETRPNAFVVEV